MNQYLPHIAYDSVVLGFSGEELKILIMEYHNTGLFALPGGFVRTDEDLDSAVRRGLHERTGLSEIFLEQFHTFGDVARFKPEVMEAILKANNHDVPANYWMKQRFISVAYYALINYNDVIPKPDALSDSCRWYNVDNLPRLILDHKGIVEKAIDTLRQNIHRKVVGVNLLPEKFTMNELQKVYEKIMGQSMRRTTFQRTMLATDMLERHEKRFTGGAHKAPYLYSFRQADKSR
ncbi:NUDIX domain-containing protein [Chryseolinea sp. T2]|uniref:NUDIX hydrolase n=1 Tax=Chryseolinea sp. T2 TaxID=3129255 RepID=UPI003078179D